MERKGEKKKIYYLVHQISLNQLQFLEVFFLVQVDADSGEGLLEGEVISLSHGPGKLNGLLKAKGVRKMVFNIKK